MTSVRRVGVEKGHLPRHQDPEVGRLGLGYNEAHARKEKTEKPQTLNSLDPKPTLQLAKNKRFCGGWSAQPKP